VSAPSPRGKQVLVWAAATFVAVQLSASVLFDYCWTQFRFPALHQQIVRFEPIASDVNVVFLGSSRTGYLLQEDEFNRVARDVTGDDRVKGFNAFVPAGDPLLAQQVFEELLDHGAQPRFVVIELCPEGVNERTAWFGLYGAWAIRWHEVPAHLRELATKGNALGFVRGRLIPISFFRDQIRRRVAGHVMAWMNPKGRETPAAGPPPLPGLTMAASNTGPKPVTPAPDNPAQTWQLRIAEALRDAKIDPNRSPSLGVDVVEQQLTPYQPGGSCGAALERILARCVERGIEPILVAVPLTSGHRACYTTEVEAAFQAYLAEINRKHGCRFVDYRALLPDHFFVDHHHVAPDGGTIYSQKIALDVLAPAWLEASGEH
jgi:hypothetical protein